MPPPLLFAVPFLAGVLLHRAVPLAVTLPGGEVVAAGGILLVIGAGIALSAVFTFSRHGTTILPARRTTTTVVTTGPYRFTRNPMYVSMGVIYLALALLLNLLWPVCLLPLAITAVDRYAIRREERYLAQKFGAAYQSYRERVRRWL